MMKRPKESATGSGLLAPFTTPVWLLIILSLLVVGPLIHFIIFLRTKLCRDKDSKIYSLQSCMWFVYGALLKQGTTLSPTTGEKNHYINRLLIYIVAQNKEKRFSLKVGTLQITCLLSKHTPIIKVSL